MLLAFGVRWFLLPPGGGRDHAPLIGGPISATTGGQRIVIAACVAEAGEDEVRFIYLVVRNILVFYPLVQVSYSIDTMRICHLAVLLGP